MILSFAKAGASYIAAGARSDMSQLGRDVIAAAESAKRPIPKFLPVRLDVTDEKSVDAAANLVEAEFGRCDILVHNAGIMGCLKPIAESDPAERWHNFEVNVRGTYLISRAFILLLLDSHNGQKTVINVSSVGAHLVNPLVSAYQTSKLALLRYPNLSSIESTQARGCSRYVSIRETVLLRLLETPKISPIIF